MSEFALRRLLQDMDQVPNLLQIRARPSCLRSLVKRAKFKGNVRLVIIHRRLAPLSVGIGHFTVECCIT